MGKDSCAISPLTRIDTAFDTPPKSAQTLAMQHEDSFAGNSAFYISQQGQKIPGGAEDSTAFELRQPSGAAIPVLIAVPHAGRCYPDSLLANMRHPAIAALRLEDRLVDVLGKAVAAETGAALLIAHAPRAMIDLNRAPSDIDWDMLGLKVPTPERYSAPPANARARSGLGLVPRRLNGMGEIWRSRLAQEDLTARIEAVHRPYHATLENALRALRNRFGAALLIDLHSMPPLPAHDGPPAQIVLGDRFGASCHATLSASAFAHFAQSGWLAAHNRPYAGGYGLDRHAAPRLGLHALQLELDRAAYLDESLRDIGAGCADMVDMLVKLVRRLAPAVAALGQRDGAGWAEAAE